MAPNEAIPKPATIGRLFAMQGAGVKAGSSHSGAVPPLPTWVDDRSRAGYGFSAMSGRLWRYAISDGVPKRSLVIALIVGTILNLINQGDVLVAGAALDMVKLLLTYVVPYCVSTYGAVSYRLHAARTTTGLPSLSSRQSVNR